MHDEGRRPCSDQIAFLARERSGSASGTYIGILGRFPARGGLKSTSSPDCAKAAGLSNTTRGVANWRAVPPIGESTPGRDRACNLRIRSQRRQIANRRRDTELAGAQSLLGASGECGDVALGRELAPPVTEDDLHLRLVVQAWPRLSQVVRQAIVALATTLDPP